MKRILFLFFILSALFCSAFAQSVDSVLLKRFEADMVKIQRQKIPYRVAVTASESQEKPIMVVYLHSSRAKGNDNLMPLADSAVPAILKYLDETQTSAHFLVPQCTKKRWWNEAEDAGREMQALVKTLIENYATEHELDMSRIYVIGVSSGGSGVLKLMNDYSTFFAAGMTIATYPRYVVERIVARTPYCCIVGENDDIATPAELTKFTNKLKSTGGEVFFKILPNKNHGATCRDGIQPEFLQWLFSQKRNKN